MDIKDLPSEEFKEISIRIGDSFRKLIDNQLAGILLAQEKYEILKDSGNEVDNIYKAVTSGVSTGDALKDINDAWEKLNNIKPNEPTIDQLKKQIKYSKNPLEVKMLNKKLNQMYKDMKRR